MVTLPVIENADDVVVSSPSMCILVANNLENHTECYKYV